MEYVEYVFSMYVGYMYTNHRLPPAATGYHRLPNGYIFTMHLPNLGCDSVDMVRP